ncbi:MAG: hypothetical protein OXL41_05300 [Nitrospinae bacterium]|nr:hypothetical protein [Nitrospinota bacterium]
MVGIERVKEIVAVLEPHWKEIEEFVEAENMKFKALLRSDHTKSGRILKCHLIAETYVERYLCEKLSLAAISSARLSYFQKVMLLPEDNGPPAIIKPGLLLLNKIRNKFAHNLDTDVSIDELEPMIGVLAVTGRSINGLSAIDAIESFTALACTWLLVSPPHLEALFAKAFSNVTASANNQID